MRCSPVQKAVVALLCVLGLLAGPSAPGSGTEETAGQGAPASPLAPNPPLSLEAALQATFTHNPELQAMAKEAEAAQSSFPNIRFWEDPRAGIRFYQVPIGDRPDQAMDIDYFVRQKLPFPGKVKAASRMAYHNYLHHLEALDAERLALTRELKVAYVKLLTLRKKLQLNLQAQDLLRSMIESAQRRLSSAKAPAYESVQGQTRLASLLIEHERLVQDEGIAQAKLNQLMNRPVHRPLELDPHFAFSGRMPELQTLLNKAAREAPLLQTAEHRSDEKKWGLRAAQKEFFPDFEVGFEYVQRPGDQEDAWTGELMLNLPVLVRKKKLAVKQAEAEWAGARFAQQAAQNETAYRVRELYERLKASKKILRLQEDTLLPQSKQAAELLVTAYLSGKASFFETIDSLESFFDAKAQYWDALNDCAQSVYELEEAVGSTQAEWDALAEETGKAKGEIK